MKRTSLTLGGNHEHADANGYAGIGWLLLSIVLFALVFLPVAML